MNLISHWISNKVNKRLTQKMERILRKHLKSEKLHFSSLWQRAPCGHFSTFISGGRYGFSIILVWLSPSDLWLYLRERPFYPWLLMAYKKITSPTKCPLLIAFQSCLGAVWVWSLVDHECVCVLMCVCGVLDPAERRY